MLDLVLLTFTALTLVVFSIKSLRLLRDLVQSLSKDINEEYANDGYSTFPTSHHD